MTIERVKIGSKNSIAHAPVGVSWASIDDVLLSWRNNQFNYPESN